MFLLLCEPKLPESTSMFRDFEKAPSKSSYQLKFILAALALVALVAAWIANSNTGHDLKSTQLERDRVTALLDDRSQELESAERDILNLRSEKAALEESIACLLYTSPSPRDRQKSRMPSSA